MAKTRSKKRKRTMRGGIAPLILSIVGIGAAVLAGASVLTDMKSAITGITEPIQQP